MKLDYVLGLRFDHYWFNSELNHKEVSDHLNGKIENLHFDLTFEIRNLANSQAEQTDGQKWPTLPYKETCPSHAGAKERFKLLFV